MQDSVTTWKRLRSFAGRTRRRFRAERTRVLRRVGILSGSWKEGLNLELGGWEELLKDGGRKWVAQAYKDRTDPNFELQDELKALVPADAGTVVRILDVGAGPLTSIGKKWSGRTVEITAVDPLAEEYHAMMKRIGLEPVIPVSVAHGERLLETFRPNSFDLVHASNALDHSYDPVLCIRQMLAVVKPLHYVYLWHFAMEGLGERYGGLHQWNFYIQNGEFMLDDGKEPARSINELLADEAEVTCKADFAYHRGVVIAIIKKLAPTAAR